MPAIMPRRDHNRHNSGMLIQFFFALRKAGLKPSLTEFLALLELLSNGYARGSVEEFHTLARLAMVKDESRFDRFDRAFGAFFEGLELIDASMLTAEVPDEWLRREIDRWLSDEEKAKLKSLGDLETLMETLRQRLAEQKDRHQGGNKWIGTGGTSPFGHGGYHPEGVRIGGRSQHRRAAKVWERREFANLDDSLELGTRNLKMALRKLRRFARTGAQDELDMDGTIRGTARNAGWLDLKFIPERHNAVKILLFLDVGGSMDDHVRVCEELFSAARSEFKHLESFYFHNFLYERVWRENARRWQEHFPLQEILHRYGSDYRVIFVGDASMSPYEVLSAGGSVEHWNEEAGAVWMQRLMQVYSRVVWLNPVPEEHWPYTPSIQIIRELISERMFPLSVSGIESAIQALGRPMQQAVEKLEPTDA